MAGPGAGAEEEEEEEAMTGTIMTSFRCYSSRGMRRSATTERLASTAATDDSIPAEVNLTHSMKECPRGFLFFVFFCVRDGEWVAGGLRVNIDKDREVFP